MLRLLGEAACVSRRSRSNGAHTYLTRGKKDMCSNHKRKVLSLSDRKCPASCKAHQGCMSFTPRPT
jgi:hypothetical protein